MNRIAEPPLQASPDRRRPADGRSHVVGPAAPALSEQTVGRLLDAVVARFGERPSATLARRPRPCPPDDVPARQSRGA